MAEPTEDRRALYLRWRPTGFADVVGQEHVVRTLRNAVQAGTPAHAYLLAGPRGTGKTSIARILYRAVNCERPVAGDPCSECHPCRTALDGRALDLVEIDAASNRGIDDIRDLREKVAFSPSEVRYRVYIVDEAHELTAPAWDAFLKTLEEPPPHAIFVLATTEAHKIPGTIVSRCQRFDFRRIRAEAISARLIEIAEQEGLSLEPRAAERLARMARGGLRDAISLLDQSASFTAGQVDLEALREALGLSDIRVVQQLAEAVAGRDAAAALEVLVAVADAGADVRLFADDLARLLRGLLWSAVGGGRALVGEYAADEAVWLEAESVRWDQASLSRLIRAITDGLARIRDSGQFQLHLELAVLEACAGGPTLDAPSTPRRVVASRPTEPRPDASDSAPPEVEGRAEPSSPPVEADLGRPSPFVDDELIDSVGDPLPQTFGETSSRSVEPARSESDGDSGRAVGLTLDGVRAHWPRVMEWVGNRNLFVHTYLQPAELVSYAEGWLIVRFAFKVHYERVNEAKNRGLVEQACQTVLGRPVNLRCEYAPPTRQAEEAIDLDDPVLKYALERFGGTAEVVDR